MCEGEQSEGGVEETAGRKGVITGSYGFICAVNIKREALNSERWAGSRVLLFRMDERCRGRFVDLLLGV